MQSTRKIDVVISGMGPGGLASAWEAIKQGKSVLIINNRDDEFVRIQRVVVDMDTRDYLLKMLDGNDKNKDLDNTDKNFLKELSGSSTIALKDIERFIKRRIDEISSKNLTYLLHSQLSNIDLEQGVITVESLEKHTDEKKHQNVAYGFEYLVGADGVGRHVTNILKRSSSKEENPIKFMESKNKNFSVNNISLYLTIESKNELHFPENKQFIISTDKSSRYLYYLGLDKNSYEKSDHKKIKCSFAAEIPASLNDRIIEAREKKDETLVNAMMLEYASPLIKQSFKENAPLNKDITISLAPPSKSHGVKKDKLKALTFDIETLIETNTSAIQLENKYVFLIGDTVRTHLYHFGSGLNNTLRDAEQFGNFLKKKITLAEYCQHSKQLTERQRSLHSFAGNKTFFAEAAENRYSTKLLTARNLYHELIEKVNSLPSSVDSIKTSKLKEKIHSQYQQGLAEEDMDDFLKAVKKEFIKEIELLSNENKPKFNG